MTIALIGIPHQLPARIHWFDDRTAVIHAAVDLCLDHCDPPPYDFDDAVHCLSDDWHMHLVVESHQDLQQVSRYQGHQRHRVRAMLDELNDVFMIKEVLQHDET